jgi:hypothetical protein
MRRQEGETLFGFKRTLNKPRSSFEQLIDLFFNSITEAFGNSKNKFFIYSFFEVLVGSMIVLMISFLFEECNDESSSKYS